MKPKSHGPEQDDLLRPRLTDMIDMRHELVKLPYRRADGPLNLLVVSTGIKLLGDGEWQAIKHSVQGRHQWHKVNRRENMCG